ncbi:MAG: tRNA (guanosine(37)-N1)-methyltransferase TrmD [Verrucomicrobiota bacterium]|nr:MAG: tRNA (guanosine(37)-N1)-methyltransferase TrmD [Verrucomicrobiota bacterium]
MRIDLISLFPDMLDGFMASSILARAQKQGFLEYHKHNLRQWSENKHFKVDDRPFGGGAGMLLQPGPVIRAIQALRTEESCVIYPCPDGVPLTTEQVQILAQHTHLIFLSGHYEGLDQRVRDRYIDQEFSIGDYVLTNGTLAAAVMIDAICRYIPGVLGNNVSLEQDSLSDGLLTFPQYTQPREFEGITVPEVLLSGNHAEIDRWRYAQRLEKTRQRRPDLWAKYIQSHNDGS